MKRDRQRLRPEGAPALGTTYRDWRDFTDRVARPWIENDGDDPQVDNWYRTLMIEADPWYLACALVFADNRIRELERLALVEQCERELAGVYRPEGVAIWMRSGHQAFGMHSAEEMIRMGRGAEVLAEIERLRTGAFG